ncbi:biosynthetic-type acetolactate synthase large subunit [Cohnella thailandensis]|uniref:Acetolactate synthase n=1 Tax=Cohnella thailandensis TaxID=557557 RepID=A0A841SQV5_9BACL|nr:biosynthetic-type acetolactate synthase large subunit [Cohnella thailandensis]MBB6632528.1 biosynthetic-type acetolactate synthase large subunit [Cohnella thailandensis]MBP1971820.1 acetolactate synthase-1/2/3 large subunit [Cohnella thailandensis]
MNGLLSQEAKEKLLRKDEITGSEILLRTLLLEGVECVFGYPGGAVLYIYDAMHDNPDFRHLLTRHEQGAIHAADGYARSTGKIGVCLATSGPGATNLVTGIATAFMDSVPLVVITGNVPTTLIGTDSFQEADIVGITQPITKHSFMVQRAEDLAWTLRAAFRIAGTGRQGPVLVDIPKDVSAERTAFVYPTSVELPGYSEAPRPSAAAIEELAEAIHAAHRPVVLAGGGVISSGASAELERFLRLTGFPVATTLLGLGSVASAYPGWLGMPGMHGTYAANQALIGCDLLIAVGARFDDRVTMKLDGFARNARIAHIDIDAAELGKLVPTSICIAGDAKQVLGELNSVLEKEEDKRARRLEQISSWTDHVHLLSERYPLQYRDSDTTLKPQYVMEMIADTTGGEAIVTTDVGQHQMWAAQFGRYVRPRSFLSSGGLGTMGFGFPSAIGAQIGNPDRIVVSVNGDGGMQMCSQELAICAIHNIPVKIAVFNNRTLGMIRQWQELIYEGRYSHIDLSGSPDFVKLAEAYGVKGLRASSKQEAEAAWQEALSTPGPVLIDFEIDPNELVYPMVPQGEKLENMILGDFEDDGFR